MDYHWFYTAPGQCVMGGDIFYGHCYSLFMRSKDDLATGTEKAGLSVFIPLGVSFTGIGCNYGPIQVLLDTAMTYFLHESSD